MKGWNRYTSVAEELGLLETTVTTYSIWARVNRQLTENQRKELQRLVAGGTKEQTPLDRLRHGPASISPDELKKALVRIKELREVGVSELDLSWLAPDRVKKLARHAGLSKAYTINRLAEPRKWATLAAFVYTYESRAIDDALDLFDSLVQTRLTRAGQQGEKKRIRTLRDLDVAARRLGETGKLLLSLNPYQPIYLDEVLFSVITAVWQPYVISEEGHIDLRYYTFCVLLQLRDALRRRSIFAAGSERWGDLRHKLLSEATNLGLSPFVDPNNLALTRGRLTWVRHNFIRTETIVKANARLVAMQDTIPLAHAWGGGEVAVADGLRFVVPVRSAHAGASDRYLGRQRGITWYHWMIDQQMDIRGIAIAGTLKDAPYLLDGLVEQETHHRPTELITDTGGYSDIVFGFFRLLGYRFSPRLADLGDARFWRMNRQTDYGVLNDLARHKTNNDLIADNWDDMLRATGSLQMGMVKPSELIKSLHRAGRTSTLGRAIGELGRLEKTLFLLSWVDDISYRRRVLTQLTRIEHRHRLAGAIRFGRKGKLYEQYREGQEDELNTLGLVLRPFHNPDDMTDII